MESPEGVEAEVAASLWNAARWVEERSREDLPATGGQSQDVWGVRFHVPIQHLRADSATQTALETTQFEKFSKR